ncbi:MAG: response regulator [Candidatus Thermoplasmatota archaeon]|nr:response regulator [Candidatus Thermoplasmatota archaeon]
MKKILIVDDSKFIGLTTKRSLEELEPNYSILYVDSGQTCLDILKYNSFDIMLLDIEMPGMNGWQVYKRLRENKKMKSIPVVFYTSKEDNFSKSFGRILGNAYLEKGIGMKELKDRIDFIIKNPVKIDESKEKIIEESLDKLIQQ